MRTITKIFLIITILSLILFIIYGIYLNRMAEHLCDIKCEKENSLANEVYHSGDWKLNDICVCIHENQINASKLGT